MKSKKVVCEACGAPSDWSEMADQAFKSGTDCTKPVMDKIMAQWERYQIALEEIAKIEHSHQAKRIAQEALSKK